jgi:hypothetical protein
VGRWRDVIVALLIGALGWIVPAVLAPWTGFLLVIVGAPVAGGLAGVITRRVGSFLAFLAAYGGAVALSLILGPPSYFQALAVFGAMVLVGFAALGFVIGRMLATRNEPLRRS